MGTIRKLTRKVKRWFDREAMQHLDEARQVIMDEFADMRVALKDLFDDDKRDAIADELRDRVHSVGDELKGWVIEWALETIWDEVRDTFKARWSE